MVRIRVVLAAGGVTLAACATEPQVTNITFNQAAAALDAIGATVQFTVSVTDQDDQPIAGVLVTWSSSDSEVARVSAGGLVTAVANGGATISAAADGVTRTVPVSVTQAVAGVIKLAGDGQAAMIGTTLPIALEVEARDRLDHPVAGSTIQFTVSTAGGTVDPVNATTGADGRASTTWTLGTVAGTHTLTATAGVAAGAPAATFTATALAESTTVYDVVLRYLSTVTPTVQAAFEAAEDRWQAIVTGDLPDVPMMTAPGQCGANDPGLNETVDDLLILVTVDAIDGPGNVVGQAGPCFLRTSNDLTIVGQMTFDEADLALMEASGVLVGVIVHEMGHVLGFGSLWDRFGYLQNPSLPDSPGADTHFNGPLAIAAFDDLGGTAYTGGAKVPVENNASYGEGTRDAHWREDVFDHELLTGVIETAGMVMPLSTMTIASLADLGYAVDMGQADPYTQDFSTPAALRGPSGPGIVLVNDVLRGPMRLVDTRGRVVRVITP